MRWATLGVAALVLLAGCAGSGHKKADDARFSDLGLQATSTTGVIRGVVVDDAIRPVANATVYLSGQKGGEPKQASSSGQGAFAFSGLDPGTYFLQVKKGGFLMAQQSVDVVAGVAEPPVVKVQLLPDPGYIKPYTESFVFDGFMQCSAGAAADSGDYGVENACSESPGGVQPFANDKTFVQYPLSGKPQWVQAEMVWTSTQAVSKSMNHNFAIADASELDGWKDLSVDGQSPLVNTMDEKTAATYIDNGTLTERIFPWTDSYPGPVVSIQQKFQVFTTVFYGYEPPSGWMLSNGDAIPPPPA